MVGESWECADDFEEVLFLLVDVLAASMYCSSDRWLEVHCALFNDCAISDFTGNDTSVGEETVSSPNALDSRAPDMKTVSLLACSVRECGSPPASLLISSGAAKIDWGSIIKAVLGSFEAPSKVG